MISIRRSHILICIVIVIALLEPPSATAQDASIQVLINSYNDSGQELFKQFSRKRGNIVFSPYSIGTAMAMARSGARGNTEIEMAKVLKQRFQRSAMDSANARALATLSRYDRSSEPPACPSNMLWTGKKCEASLADGNCQFPAQREGERCIADPMRRVPSAEVRVANALLVPTNQEVVAKEYSALLREKYTAAVLQGLDLNEINSWVKQKTMGKIDRIIDQLPNVALLNAVYFKARWDSIFSETLTQNRPFHLSKTQKVSVSMMMQDGPFSVVKRSSYRAIRIPYDIQELAMIVVLPKGVDGLSRLGSQVDMKELSKVLRELRIAPKKNVALQVPRFRIAFASDNLISLFRKAGMIRAFDRSQADFSGITGRDKSEVPFWIDEIRHRATIDVMEDGTEAAATTAVPMEVALKPERRQKSESFYVDRPFLFFIVENATGLILFQGRIVDPR